MTSFQFRIKTQLKVFIVLVCLYFISEQSQMGDNDTQILNPNIPSPTRVAIYSEEYIKKKVNATKPFYIENPEVIKPIYDITFQTDEIGSCQVVGRQVKKHFGEYLKFKDYELGQFDSWTVQISDATYFHETSQIVLLLTDGSLLRANLNVKIEGVKNLSEFEKIQYANSQEVDKVWQLDEYELFSSTTDMFLFRQNQLKRIQITENTTQSSIMNQKWEFEDLENGQYIKKVVKERDELYLLKSNKVEKIAQTFIDKDFIVFDYLGEPEFIDMAIEDGNIYILDRNNGILIVNIQSGQLINEPLEIDFVDSAESIDVKGQTILVGYRLFHQNYVAEIFLQKDGISSDSQYELRMNKIYYRFGDMKNIVMFNNFALIYSRSQMNLFQHSINRKGPLNATQTQLIFNSMYPKILDVIPLEEDRVKYILVQKNGVFVEFLGDDPSEENKSSAITLQQLRCTFSEKGKYNVTVNYIGICDAGNKSSTDSYCFKQEQYQFKVHREKWMRKMEAFNNHSFLVLILMVAFFLVLGIVLIYRRVTVQRRIRLIEEINRRAGASNQMVSMQV